MEEELSKKILTIGKERVEKWVHPLDRKAVQDFLRFFLDPELLMGLLASPRPKLSATPTLEEIWYALNFINRRNGLDAEVIAAITLYEDAFGIYDPERHEKIPTIGGVLTHNFRMSETIGELRTDEKVSSLAVRLANELQELLYSPLANQPLKEAFSLDQLDLTSRFSALHKIWLRSADLMFIESPEGKQYYRPMSDPKFREGIIKLALLRTSPEFNFLFGHYSALGILNSST
ncbi:hypothetical protein HY612_01305 [Candidatus Roizmanbacteria bacterium]|nr:hypothetical protein [Candidatus Roizmanbacteria bacterium]